MMNSNLSPTMTRILQAIPAEGGITRQEGIDAGFMQQSLGALKRRGLIALTNDRWHLTAQGKQECGFGKRTQMVSIVKVDRVRGRLVTLAGELIVTGVHQTDDLHCLEATLEALRGFGQIVVEVAS